MPRVAFCITELNVGGAERCLVELATRLDRTRFEPAVFCLGRPPAAGPASLSAKLAAAQVPVHYFGARSPFSAPRVFWQLRRRLREFMPDIVHTFLWHANVLGVFAARASGVSRIVTGLRVAEPRRRWRWRWERLAGRRADRHVAVSEGVAVFAREMIGLRAENIVVIPNGVEVPTGVVPADLSKLGLPAGRRAIAFVGRLDEQKGIAWLIEQAPALFKNAPDHDLVVVGAGPLQERLQTQAKRLEVAERIHFAGWRDDVPSILAAADLLVVPSQWEGMSNVVLEAMAVARPVVAFDVEGIIDAIGDGSSPQIVAREDRPGFVERVVQIAGNEQMRSLLGEQNRWRVSDHFGIDQMVARHERLYEGLIR